MCTRLISYCFCLAANEYSDGGAHTHHHQAPNGQASASPTDVRQSQNFYPTYPAQGSVGSTIPPMHGDMEHVGASRHSHAAAAASQKEEDEERNVALFGDLPESKRRKFILVDDPQRSVRVRVRVMLDQVQMQEVPDSYRKSNSVFPRSFFPVQMQSPPASPRGSRFFTDDPEEASQGTDAPVTGRTLVPVPLMDGSETSIPRPRVTKTKRRKEVTLNDLGYRMSWSQSRVFSGRTLFLQRSRKYSGPPW